MQIQTHRLFTDTIYSRGTTLQRTHIGQLLQTWLRYCATTHMKSKNYSATCTPVFCHVSFLENSDEVWYALHIKHRVQGPNWNYLSTFHPKFQVRNLIEIHQVVCVIKMPEVHDGTYLRSVNFMHFTRNTYRNMLICRLHYSVQHFRSKARTCTNGPVLTTRNKNYSAQCFQESFLTASHIGQVFG